MDRIVTTHEFGPHRVNVVESVDDEGTVYWITIDDILVTGPPLPAPPRFEEIVRIYADWQREMGAG